MNTQRNKTILGILAIIGVVLGGISFALADEVETADFTPCEGAGPRSLVNGNGFWLRLTEEQRTKLLDSIQELIEDGATPEDIRELKATLLEEWGFEAPLWSGPHRGGKAGGNGQRKRDGQGNGVQRGGRGNGGKGPGPKGNKGVCPNTN